jgi:hypothetical protein
MGDLARDVSDAIKCPDKIKFINSHSEIHKDYRTNTQHPIRNTFCWYENNFVQLLIMENAKTNLLLFLGAIELCQTF